MPNFRPVTELFAEIEAAKTVAEKSNAAMQLAQALIGDLWLSDLNNILDHSFLATDALNDNLNELVESFKSPKNLMLAFCTTLHVIPVKPGYKFDLSNNHRLAETETLLLAYGDAKNVLLPLHNLFLLLDGQTPVYLDAGDFDSVLKQLSTSPYFELSQAKTHHNHKLIKFTRTDLLEKLNNGLAQKDFHLGKQMFDFLIKGKHGVTFNEKLFSNYKEKYSLAA